MAHRLRFRQVHLDFHTSPHIPGVGSRFDKEQFQKALKVGHVDSITLFSKCHHGMTYHPTSFGKMHPALNGFNLLRAQMDACHEIGVATPVYISAGFDMFAAHEHPDWAVTHNEYCHDPRNAGFYCLCFRSPYLDYLCEQIREVCRLFPDANGIFLDIVGKRPCTCEYCQRFMAEQGLDLADAADIDKAAEATLRLYYGKTTEAVHEHNPDMPVFHNSGNVGPKFRPYLPFFSHMELESLPTGGWGYDHFPLSMKYVDLLGFDTLGMTGKFHESWGEFGGFKHPNALRYECDAMIANGAKCSVGDQCHPSGEMDMGTYRLIGEAYADVERKEAWCDNTAGVADIGVVQECAQPNSDAVRATGSDTGAGRMLLESHLLFDMLDNACDFSKYRLLIVPDGVVVGAALKAKLDAYVAEGGKVLFAGAAGLSQDRKSFLFDFGATTEGKSPFNTDYILPKEGLRAPYAITPVVMYGSQRVKVTDGESLGDIHDPYFNRTYRHFCSHREAPNRIEPSGYACGVRKGNLAYLAHPVFSYYASNGAVTTREYAMRVLRTLLGAPTIETKGLPTTGRVTLRDQPAEKRRVLHLLYAPTINRGGIGGRSIEVIEEIPPLCNVSVTYRPDAAHPVSALRLVPEGIALSFDKADDGSIRFTVAKLDCHQMVEIR